MVLLAVVQTVYYSNSSNVTAAAAVACSASRFLSFKFRLQSFWDDATTRLTRAPLVPHYEHMVSGRLKKSF